MNNPATNAPPLDCLAIGAHPDDAELFCGGTLAVMAARGLRVGILDLTRGEMATRGTPELRAQEAAEAARILRLTHRDIMDLGDGDLANTQERRMAVVEALRRLRPRLVLTHGATDRHPDHRRTHELVHDACFFAGVGNHPAGGERWRVEALAYFPGNQFREDERADWVVDISAVVDLRKAALEAYASQFLADGGDPAPTYIASRAFWDELDRRLARWGHRIGAAHGEPFILDRPASAQHPLVQMTM